MPSIDIVKLLDEISSPPPLSFDPSFRPISTDVLLIRGRGATPVTQQPHIFYENDFRAIVYRSKDTVNGLASTIIWTWRGKKSLVGEDELWKVKDLEARFGTKAIGVMQGEEPMDLISLLGGMIAMRIGSAAHWSVENTSMHCVRSVGSGSSAIITEVDLVRLASFTKFSTLRV